MKSPVGTAKAGKTGEHVLVGKTEKTCTFGRLDTVKSPVGTAKTGRTAKTGENVEVGENVERARSVAWIL
jgi:hypothetical protein